MAKNRNGKPTPFQVEAIKKAGLTLNWIKTYRDAENALRRIKRTEKSKAPANKCEKRKEVKTASNSKKRDNAPVVQNKGKKIIAGCGHMRVSIGKAEVIEALLVGFARSILAFFGTR